MQPQFEHAGAKISAGVFASWSGTAAGVKGMLSMVHTDWQAFLAVGGFILSAIGTGYAIAVARATLKVRRWEEEVMKERRCNQCDATEADAVASCPFPEGERPTSCTLTKPHGRRRRRR